MNQAFIEHFKDLIAARDKSNNKTAKTLGIDRTYIGRILSGERDFSPQMLEHVADRFELSETEKLHFRALAFPGSHPIVHGLNYLIDTEQRVNAERPQDMLGGKDATRTYVLAMMVELSELVQELDWKPWKSQTKPVDRHRVADEYADVLAFLGIITANVMAQTALTAQDLAEAFDRKTLVNISRANGQVEGYVPDAGVSDSSDARYNRTVQVNRFALTKGTSTSGG